MRLSIFACLLLLLGACGPSDPSATDETPSASPAPVVKVYSARHYDTDDRLYERFTEETGIEVQVIEGDSAALLERLRRQGEQSPADLFITVDAGRLQQAVDDGIFQPADSATLTERIPPSLRHPDGLWFGLTKRARVIVTAKDRVETGAIERYEDLADPVWRDRVLIRSSSNVYNQSLIGSILAANGPEATEEWCRAVVANMARVPQGGDRDQIRAVAAGEGDIAVVNTYYLAQMMAADAKPEDQEAAAQVAVVFPNQGDRGTHVNLSGAGVIRGATHAENAVRLLEYLTSDDAQRVFAGDNKEYPVVAGLPAVPELETFGAFEEDALNASVFGSMNKDALMLMDRCGWR